METRISTPFTGEHFAEFVRKMVGQPYWYGTTGNKATQSLLNRKTAQYPSHYTESRLSKYKKDIENRKIVCDCIGGCKAYAWTGGGDSILACLEDPSLPVSSKYGANGCPDKSANGMFSYAKEKKMPYGTLDTLPDKPGLALWKDGHVGYTLDGIWAVEWRSFSYGCVKTKIKDRNWKNWYCLPFLDYGDIGKRILSKGMKGEDVRALQNALLSAGYALPKYGADGDFGNETETALKAFQKDHGIEESGIYTEETEKALTNKPEDDKNLIFIRSSGGAVNIRAGNGENYPVLLKAENGAGFPFVAASENGWNAVALSSSVGWVSAKYSGK